LGSIKGFDGGFITSWGGPHQEQPAAKLVTPGFIYSLKMSSTIAGDAPDARNDGLKSC
jgi:hypothetical protein